MTCVGVASSTGVERGEALRRLGLSEPVTARAVESACRALMRIVDPFTGCAPNAAVASEVASARESVLAGLYAERGGVDAPRLSGSAADEAAARSEETVAALHDPRRLAELRATGLLDVEFEAAFDRITLLTRRVLDAPIATVSLVDEHFQHCLSRVGLPAADGPRTPILNSYCQFAVATGERLVISDARTTLLLQNSPAITENDVISYAGEPLEMSTGQVLGTLCVMGPAPREWSEEDLAMLRDLAALATAEIESRVRVRAMIRMDMLVSELHEPVDLLGDTVRGIAAATDRDTPIPRIRRLAGLACTRYATVESVQRKLREAGAPQRPAPPRQAARVRLVEGVQRAVRDALIAAPQGAVKLALDEVPVLSGYDPRLLQRGLAYLVTATLQHAAAATAVSVALELGDGEVLLDVDSPGGAIPTSELARMVARLEGLLGVSPDDAPLAGARCAIAVEGRNTIAHAGRVRGQTGPGGTHITVTFPLADLREKRDGQSEKVRNA